MKDVKYYNNTQKEALEYTSKIVDFGVTLIVYAALNELVNAYVALQQSKYFKHTVKRRAKIALSMRNSKVKELKDIVLHQGFAESYWDAIIDTCEKDVLNLKREIKAKLDEDNVKDAELYSIVETARVLLEAAKIQFEEVIKDCNNKFLSKDINGMKGLSLFDTFKEFYIISIYLEWNAVCNELYSNQGVDSDLNNEKIASAFDAMASKFAKGQYIDSCLEAAGKEYPEFADAKVIITE